MRVDIVSLFPEMIAALCKGGVVAGAVARDILQLEVWNPRDYTSDSYATVDDRPYGGGPGMVLMAEPVVKAIRDAKEQQSGSYLSIYMTPQGSPLTQKTVGRLSSYDGLVVLAGRYEGVDERVIDLEIDEEYSLGDYVISGGELAAMVLTDAVARQCDGVLGDADSAKQDSFMTGLLDHPHYTRPAKYEGLAVPEVLCSGNHEEIRRWRMKQALAKTLERRPDLMEQHELSEEEQALLNEYLEEKQNGA